MEKATTYAAEDADFTFRLYEKLQPMLAEQQLDGFFNEMEIAHTFEAIEGATHSDYVMTEAFLRALWTATYTKMRPD